MASQNGVPQEDDSLLISSRRDALVITNNHTAKTVLCSLLVMALISISYAFIRAPLYRLYEVALCGRYYREHNPSVIGPDGEIPEEKCKLDSIQKDLALLLAKQVQINCFASVLASVYMRGFGRRTFLKLNISCFLCSQVFICFCLWYSNLPIELSWGSSAFILVACGPEMRQEAIFMVIADATSKDERFTVFTLGQIIVLPLAFIAERLSANLMAHSLRTPIALGFSSILLTLAVISRMPFDVLTTTNVNAHLTNGQEDQYQAMSDDQNIPTGQGSLQLLVSQNIKSLRILGLSNSILFLTLTFLVTSSFGQLMAGTIFLQYVEKQLGFDMANASKIQSHSDWMNMISLIIIFLVCGKPSSGVFGRFGSSLKNFLLTYVNRDRLLSIKEITISRFCAVMMALGFVVIGIAHRYRFVVGGLLFCAAGQAFRMSTRASLTAMVKEVSDENTTGLYTIIFYLDLIGGALMNLVLAKSFALGLEWNGPWIGLPLFCAAIFWSLVGIITFSVKSPPADGEQNSNIQQR